MRGGFLLLREELSELDVVLTTSCDPVVFILSLHGVVDICLNIRIAPSKGSNYRMAQKAEIQPIGSYLWNHLI